MLVPVGKSFIERIRRMPGAAPDLVQGQIPRDGEQPGGEFCRHFVAMRRLEDLHEHVLRDVFRLGRVAEGPGHEINHGLLVFVDKRLESRAIPCTHAEHEGCVWVEIRGHYAQHRNKNRPRLKVAEKTTLAPAHGPASAQAAPVTAF
jgi:hypothetical protein